MVATLLKKIPITILFIIAISIFIFSILYSLNTQEDIPTRKIYKKNPATGETVEKKLAYAKMEFLTGYFNFCTDFLSGRLLSSKTQEHPYYVLFIAFCNSTILIIAIAIFSVTIILPIESVIRKTNGIFNILLNPILILTASVPVFLVGLEIRGVLVSLLGTMRLDIFWQPEHTDTFFPLFISNLHVLLTVMFISALFFISTILRSFMAKQNLVPLKINKKKGTKAEKSQLFELLVKKRIAIVPLLITTIIVLEDIFSWPGLGFIFIHSARITDLDNILFSTSLIAVLSMIIYIILTSMEEHYFSEKELTIKKSSREEKKLKRRIDEEEKSVKLKNILNDKKFITGLIILLILLFCLGLPLIEVFPNKISSDNIFDKPSFSGLFGKDNVGRDVFSISINALWLTFLISIGVAVISMILGSIFALLSLPFRDEKINTLHILSVVFLFLFLIYIIGGKFATAEIIIGIIAIIMISCAIGLKKIKDANKFFSLIGTEFSSVENIFVFFIELVIFIPFIIAVTLFFVHDIDLIEFILIAGVLGAAKVAAVVRRAGKEEIFKARILEGKVQNPLSFAALKRIVFPKLYRPLLVSFFLIISTMLLVESTVGFLGFPVSQEVTTFGKVLSEYRPLFQNTWWIIVLPSLALFLMLLSTLLIQESLKKNLNQHYLEEVVENF